MEPKPGRCNKSGIGVPTAAALYQIDTGAPLLPSCKTTTGAASTPHSAANERALAPQFSDCRRGAARGRTAGAVQSMARKMIADTPCRRVSRTANEWPQEGHAAQHASSLFLRKNLLSCGPPARLAARSSSKERMANQRIAGRKRGRRVKVRPRLPESLPLPRMAAARGRSAAPAQPASARPAPAPAARWPPSLTARAWGRPSVPAARW